jgi:hypothetical protein
VTFEVGCQLWWALWLKRHEKSFGVWVEYTLCCMVTLNTFYFRNQKVVFFRTKNVFVSDEKFEKLKILLFLPNQYRNPVLSMLRTAFLFTLVLPCRPIAAKATPRGSARCNANLWSRVLPGSLLLLSGAACYKASFQSDICNYLLGCLPKAGEVSSVSSALFLNL